MPWPSRLEAQRCREAWVKSTKEERRELTTIRCNDMVLYMWIADQMLALRNSEPEDQNAFREEKLARDAFRLHDLEWNMTRRPRLMRFGEAFYEADDAMDFMLAHCVDSLDDCQELLQQAKSGRVGFDAETNTLLSGRSWAWPDHAKDFWTLVVSDILQHLDSAASYARCVRFVREALTKPPASAKRSWPSKKDFADLKEGWKTLDVEERIRMTAASSSEYWFVQACDVAMAAVTLSALRGTSLEVNLLVLENLRMRAKLVASIDVNELPVPRIMLNAEYVMDPDCLEDLYKKSVRHVTEKVALVRKALCCNWEELFKNHRRPAVIASSTSTWADVERVIATLILEVLLQRRALVLKVKEAVLQHQQTDMLSTAEAACRKKREKRQATRAKQAALMKAEGERRLAEAERQSAEDGRRAAEAERQRAEELRRSQEEARVQAEVERRLYEQGLIVERREERCRILALLQKSPSWDISCLRVSRTFLDFDEGYDGVPAAFSADW